MLVGPGTTPNEKTRNVQVLISHPGIMTRDFRTTPGLLGRARCRDALRGLAKWPVPDTCGVTAVLFPDLAHRTLIADELPHNNNPTFIPTLGQYAASPQPCEGALYDAAARHELEAFGFIRRLDDLQGERADFCIAP